MSEQYQIYENENRFSVSKNLGTSEGRFLAAFIVLAILSWSIGITSLQVNEFNVKREIAAAKKAEDEANASRLKELRSIFSSAKFSDYDLPSELTDFKWKVNSKLNCKGSRDCAYPIIVSLYNCESSDLTFTFTKESGEIVDTVVVTENFVPSLEPISLYVEMTNTKDSDYINFINATCFGKSY